ncbi:uncharacterized protein LOC129940007 [Eupeodes corollae]|uniref:uncharacterized protein LOC129940007 n=1 Tax=Eupeodes corollae TaxID=290404 RepID=UPI0024916CD9|nr:uncharacterized protein LOC129940007 [Eupeodes corollae]
MQQKLLKLLLCQLMIGQWRLVDCINFSHIIELSDQVRQREEIRTMIVFSQKKFITNLTGFEELLRHESSILPLILIGEDYTENEALEKIVGLWSIVMVFMDNIDNHKMILLLNETLREMRSSKMLLVLESPPSDSKSFLTFFQTCRRLGIVNIVVMYDDQVFTYEPYPHVSLANMTSAPIEDFYPDRMYDLKGYLFRTPIQQDGSRVFIYKDKHGNEKVAGTNANLFKYFVQRHNGTYERIVENQTGFEISRGLSLVRQGLSDILMHSYTSFSPDNIGRSYPFAQIEWLIVVPMMGEIPVYRYLILPFDYEVWVCLGLSFVYISLASYLTRLYCQHLGEYGPAFTRSFAEFLYLSSTDLSCNLRTLVFEMQIFIYGLMLTNIYMAFLSAFLTTSVQDKQIDTVEDLLQSGYKIVSILYEINSVKHTNGYNKRYDSIFYEQKIDFINEYRKSLNKTFGFVFTSDRARFFLGQQKYLEKKRMHIAKSTFGSYFLIFLMQKDSPFRMNFDTILLQLSDTGLYKKWEEDVFIHAVATKYLQIFQPEPEEVFRPLTIDYLGVGWATLGIGVGLSVAVFLGEMGRFQIVRIIRRMLRK